MECSKLAAVRLHQETQAQGNTGRCSILRDFLRPLRQEHRRLGQLTSRFETTPRGAGASRLGAFWQH
jgi:hypothetical protein